MLSELQIARHYPTDSSKEADPDSFLDVTEAGDEHGRKAFHMLLYTEHPPSIIKI